MPPSTISWVRRSHSSWDPSHHSTRSGLVRAATSSTHSRSFLLRVGGFSRPGTVMVWSTLPGSGGGCVGQGCPTACPRRQGAPTVESPDLSGCDQGNTGTNGPRTVLAHRLPGSWAPMTRRAGSRRRAGSTVGSVDDAFYEPLDESAAGGAAYTAVFRPPPTPAGRGTPGTSTRGPPAALLGRAVERLGPRAGAGAARPRHGGDPRTGPGDRATGHGAGARRGRNVSPCARRCCSACAGPTPDHAPRTPTSAVPVARMSAWRVRTTPEPLALPASRWGRRRPRRGWSRPGRGLARWLPRRGGVALGRRGVRATGTGHGVDPAAGAAGGRRGPPRRCSGSLAVADSGSGISAVASPRPAVRQHRADRAPAPPARGRPGVAALADRPRPPRRGAGHHAAGGRTARSAPGPRPCSWPPERPAPRRLLAGSSRSTRP